MPEENQFKNETTNAVLAVKIDGLAERTDDRLLNIKETLTRMELSATHYSTKVELEEAKKDFNKIVEAIKNEFIQHSADDKEAFNTLKRGNEKTQGTIKYAMGAFAGVMVILQFLVPYILSKLHG